MASRFPYADRARAAEEARRAVHAAFGEMRRRDDPTDPATRRWLDAIDTFGWTHRLALPPNFDDAMQAVGQGRFEGLDILIDFLEADPWFFRSGYIKEEVIRRLRRVPLDEPHRQRLRKAVLAAIDSRDRREFRRYCRLATWVQDEGFIAEVMRRAASPEPGISRRARWVLDALRHADQTVAVLRRAGS